MMNEAAEQDLKRYKNTTLIASASLLTLLFSGLACACVLDFSSLTKPLLGAILGTLLASLNLFALGYAFYVVAIKGGHRWVILFPLATFVLMAASGFMLSLYRMEYILGFALGLTAPVLFAAVIVFGGKA